MRTLLLALTLAGPGCAHVSAPPPPAATLRELIGEWSGTLEYVDYQPPHRRVRLPTTLTVTDAGTTLRLAFTYDDGPGKLISSVDALSTDAETVRWAGEKSELLYRVIETKPHLLVLEVEGEDDDAPATMRETFSLGPNRFSLVKTVRPRGAGPGATFTFRHGYEFVRVAR